MTSSHLLSQTHSSDSTLIAVPRHTLEKALVIKAKYELCDAELILVKDKVVLLEKKIELKDSQIVLLTSALELSKTRGDSLTTILNNIPKAPQTKPKFMGITLPSRKATAIAAFTLGVVAGASF